jgi:hypothetical protein
LAGGEADTLPSLLPAYTSTVNVACQEVFYSKLRIKNVELRIAVFPSGMIEISRRSLRHNS